MGGSRTTTGHGTNGTERRAHPGTVDRHERDVEPSVRIFRWVAVVFAVLQIGVLYQPTPGVEVPFQRLPVAVAFAGALIALNLLSRWAERAQDPVRLRQVSLVQLSVDTLIAFAVVAIFVFDPEIRLWPLFVLPVLEGAMRFQVRGAVGTALASTALSAIVTAQWPGVTPPEVASSVAFQLGVLVTVAVGAGGLARRLEQARGGAEAQAHRLRRLSEHAPGLMAHRRLSTATSALLEATRAVVDAQRVELHLKERDGWRRLGTLGDDDELEDLVDELLERSLRDDGGPARHGGRLVVEALRTDDGVLGALVVRLRDGSATDLDLVRLLAAQGATALASAQLAETEARTITELRALDEMKDDFVHILAHELRGPIAHIGQYAHLLRERPDDLTEEQRDRFLERLEQTTERLGRLVSDVEEVTAADMGQLPVTMQPVALAPLIDEVAAQEVGTSARHRLEVDVPPDLPLVWGDPDRLRQVLSNLLSNAVKYSPDGGRVHVAATREGEVATVEVTDDGVGVPSHLQQHLFRKFVRIPSPTYAKGTGLGLYLTRRLVEGMGGEIRLVSVPERGSTFSFTLALARSAGPDVGDVTGADDDRTLAGPQHQGT